MVKDRAIFPLLEEFLSIFPAVGILGPRQVGKTTLVKNLNLDREAFYIDLEKASDRLKLSDPELFLKTHQDKTVILDEIQFMPELFAELRSLIDENRVPARFILLGSASPDLIRNSGDSLAGRIGYLELPPFTVQEVDQMDTLWLRGGFPLSFLASSERVSLIWRENFIKTYIERDLGMLGLNTDPRQVEKFWMILAHAQGSIWNGDGISRALGLTRPTVNRYLEFLEGSFMIRVLQPYHDNIKKRLVKSPKVYIRDSGILHALAGIKALEELQTKMLVGASWEGFVIEQIINCLGDAYQYFYYRTHQGSECDLILVKSGKVMVAVEIKNSLAPKITKGFRISMEDMQAAEGVVIYRGGDDFPIDQNINVMGLKSFIQKYTP
ncbi:ATP-binding protein [Litoribacter alkaliphilus]|uniref:ATP-binding protein n=1 Tax=Litoribacter ruber TaxID=702568 RepID=A0AAP2CG80_9BACT|nr:ATP-binding protein [Litoribacter alkaliphilus]MBS9523487.1 ATP-binding protein [Litoribacter alkaliphilus]